MRPINPQTHGFEREGASAERSFGANSSSQSKLRGFTLIELLIVITIIAVLASLVISASSSVQKKGARSRAEAEIAAVSAALESYKADNGDYPTNDQITNCINLVTTLMPAPGSGSKVYFEFKSKSTNSYGWTDPFGNTYCYVYTNGSPNNGTNNFDLWSTAGDTTGTKTNSWIKNW
jgi:type II secretion system protein G